MPVNKHELPFVRLLLPLCLGILLQHYFTVICNATALVWCLLLFLPFFIGALRLSKIWKYQWVYGFIMFLFLLFYGVAITPSGKALMPFKNRGEPCKVLARIVEEPEVRKNSVRCIADVVNVVTPDTSDINGRKLLLYFSLTDSAATTLKYGDIIAASVRVQQIEPASNPCQFDFANYMRLKRIFYSAYVRNHSWCKVGEQPNVLIKLGLALRRKVIDIYNRHKIEGQKLAVLSALTVGYKGFLDDELKQTFSSTGAAHILAVSGLHVGIIYMLLLVLFSFLPKRRLFRSLQLAVMLLGLWGYVLITGFSPSVCRSAVMFSILAFGNSMNLRTNIFNSLAAAAFILLITEPLYLFTVSFQLSFLAVLSIVVLSSPITSVFRVDNKILKYFWGLVAVSIAAQLGTMPVTLLNFGQFPVYFILANLIAIPLAPLIIYASLLLLLLSPISSLAGIVSKGVEYLVLGLSTGLSYVEKLPLSSITGLNITTLQSMLLLMAIVFLGVFLHSYRYKPLMVSFIGLIAFLAVGFYNNYSTAEKELVVFKLPRKSIICVRSNADACFITTDSLACNPLKKYSFYLEGYIHRFIKNKVDVLSLAELHGKHKSEFPVLRKKDGLAMALVGNKSVMLAYNDSVKNIVCEKPFEVDILIANRYLNEQLLAMIFPKIMIIDPSISGENELALMAMCATQNVKIHSMLTQGAFVMKLN